MTGQSEEVWEHMELSLFDNLRNCALLQIAHGSVRAYGYFNVGHLMCLFGSHCGPFCLAQVSITQACCLRVASI